MVYVFKSLMIVLRNPYTFLTNFIIYNFNFIRIKIFKKHHKIKLWNYILLFIIIYQSVDYKIKLLE